MLRLTQPLHQKAVDHLASVGDRLWTIENVDYIYRQFIEKDSYNAGDPMFHLRGGMQIRNILREVVKDNELPTGNWDDYYTGVLIAAYHKMIESPITLTKQPSVRVTPIGVGSAFAKRNDNSSFLIEDLKENFKLLVDIGASIPRALARNNIPLNEIDAVFISHLHADHVGGLEEFLLMHQYVYKRKPIVISGEAIQKDIWDKTLRGGCETETLKSLSDYAITIHKDGVIPVSENITLELFKTQHVAGMDSYGLVLNDNLFISGDTIFDKKLIKKYSYLEYFFHDCQLFNPGTVHATFDELSTLPPDIKERMYLYHYGDNYEDFMQDANGEGFLGLLTTNTIYEN